MFSLLLPIPIKLEGDLLKLVSRSNYLNSRTNRLQSAKNVMLEGVSSKVHK